MALWDPGFYRVRYWGRDGVAHCRLVHSIGDAMPYESWQVLFLSDFPEGIPAFATFTSRDKDTHGILEVLGRVP